MSKTTSYPASAAQLGLIERLVTERSQAVEVDNVAAFITVLRDERLTKSGASVLIDELFKRPVNVVPPAAGVVDNRNGAPFNRYSGDCVLCGQAVGAREGTYRRGARGGWETLHLPNECPAPQAVVAADTKTPDSWAAAQALVDQLPGGNYAIPSITGTNDLTFFRIVVNQGRVNPANKGRKYFRHIVGGHNPDDMKVSPAFVIKAVEAAKAVGPAQAQALYGRTFTICGRCGRQLTDEYSRQVGIGPECRKHSDM